MSEIKVNKISPRTACGTTTLGDSGDTFTIPAGVTITNNGTQTGFGGVMTPAFSAYVGTLNNIANNTTTVVTGFSERFDSNSKFDTSTGRFTPGETGRYIFYLTTRINQASSRFQVLLGKNGSNCPDADGNIEMENYGHGSNTYIGVNGFAITHCDDVNDYFTMRVWQNSGSSQTFYTNNFMGFKLIT